AGEPVELHRLRLRRIGVRGLRARRLADVVGLDEGVVDEHTRDDRARDRDRRQREAPELLPAPDRLAADAGAAGGRRRHRGDRLDDLLADLLAATQKTGVSRQTPQTWRNASHISPIVTCTRAAST